MAEETECPQVQRTGIFRVFSNEYCTPAKQEFCRLLQEGDLEKALKVLARISPSIEIEPSNKIEAIVTLVEGYKALAKRALSIIGTPDEEIRAYRALGTPAEIADRCRRLKEYEVEHPDIAELKAEIKILGQYRNEFATPEKAGDATEELEGFRESFNTPEEAKAANEELSTYEALGEIDTLREYAEVQRALSNIK